MNLKQIVQDRDMTMRLARARAELEEINKEIEQEKSLKSPDEYYLHSLGKRYSILNKNIRTYEKRRSLR